MIKVDGDPIWRGPESVTKPVTKRKAAVTKLIEEILGDPPPVKWRRPGRPRKHATGADRARAYRERKKAAS